MTVTNPPVDAFRGAVPMADFGKDHWSTFLYVETRCVDYGGELIREHLRVDPRRHPHHAHRGSSGSVPPTRLRSGPRTNHDDHDVLVDLVDAGLLRAVGTGHPKFQLTDDGWRTAGRLRRWVAEGGTYGTFDEKEAR